MKLGELPLHSGHNRRSLHPHHRCTCADCLVVRSCSSLVFLLSSLNWSIVSPIYRKIPDSE